MGRKSSLVPWFLAARFVDKQFPPFYRDERAANNETINFRYTFSRIKGNVSIIIRVYPFILSCSEFPCGVSYIPENRGTSQRKIVSKHIALMGETLMPELDLFFRYSLLIKLFIYFKSYFHEQFFKNAHQYRGDNETNIDRNIYYLYSFR